MKAKISETARYAIENPSSIREIMSLVADYERNPEKYPRPLVYLGGGWPQDPPPKPLIESLSQVIAEEKEIRLSARYPPTRGDPEFLDAVVEYERVLFGRKISPEELISGLGSTDLAGGLILATLDSGSEVIMTRPCYLNYQRQLLVETLMGVKIKWWDVLKEDRFEPNVDELQELIGPDTRMIILVTPGNPDGQVFNDATLEAISDVAEEKGVWVLIDVAYRMFHYHGMPRYYSRPRRENEVWLASMSKELRAPGWRMAYLYCDPELVRAVETVQQARTLAPTRLPQRAFVRMMRRPGVSEWLRKYMLEETPEMYGRIANMTADLLSEIDGLKVLRPLGGFYVFFNVEEVEKSSRKFVQGLLNEWQVALAPGVDFGAEGWVRLSFAPAVEDPEKIREGMQRLSRYVASLRAG